MSNRANDYAVWAYRGENNVAILCTRKEANDWWNGNSQPLHCFVRGPGGKGRTQVKNNKVKGWGVSRRSGESALSLMGRRCFGT